MDSKLAFALRNLEDKTSNLDQAIEKHVAAAKKLVLASEAKTGDLGKLAFAINKHAFATSKLAFALGRLATPKG